jgi:hypothetical protein
MNKKGLIRTTPLGNDLERNENCYIYGMTSVTFALKNAAASLQVLATFIQLSTITILHECSFKIISHMNNAPSP